MRGWMKLGAGVAGGVVATAAVAGMMGVARWKRDTARQVAQLRALVEADAGRAARETGTYAESMLSGLPAPVTRYFRYALTPGQRLIRSVRLEQTGTFAVKPEQWVPFTGTEYMSAATPAFVWDATMRMLPVVPTLVRDSYLDGVGGMRASMAGLVSVADARGTPTLAEGALMRWLAEAVWMPTALLPGRGVTWEPIDDSTARAIATDGEVRAVLDVSFAADGRLTGTRGMRWREDGARTVRLPWLGRHDGYTRVDGMMVPLEGEVGWVTTDGYQAYWRGRQRRVEFVF